MTDWCTWVPEPGTCAARRYALGGGYAAWLRGTGRGDFGEVADLIDAGRGNAAAARFWAIEDWQWADVPEAVCQWLYACYLIAAFAVGDVARTAYIGEDPWGSWCWEGRAA